MILGKEFAKIKMRAKSEKKELVGEETPNQEEKARAGGAGEKRGSGKLGGEEPRGGGWEGNGRDTGKRVGKKICGVLEDGEFY